MTRCGGSWCGSSWKSTGGKPAEVQLSLLYAQLDAAPPHWADLQVLRRPWFPAELGIQRAEALVWAPAAFRKHGVYLSARDLEAA